MSSFVQHAGSSINPKRQTSPHAHAFYLDSGNRFAFAPDLGLDKVMIYRFDAAHGKITPNEPAFASVSPGSGPRHFAFHPSGRSAYVINELLCTITGFRYDSGKGTLRDIQTLSTLPEGESLQVGYSTAEIFVHPNGKFLYGSNRGHDTIAVFAIDRKTGKLTPVQHVSTQGKIPRNFNLDPTGSYLLAANQGSDNVVVFRADPTTGRLTPTGQGISLGAPVCIEFFALKTD
jgi:6-phosphogluconolactonase